MIKKRNNGEMRDFFSSLIGQVDKKIHNYRYRKSKNDAEEKKIQQKWENKKSKIESRYVKGGLISYILPRAGIIAAGAILMPSFSFAFGTGTAFVATVGLATLGAVTLGKTVSTIYNKMRYGGPRLERQYNIQNGTFLQNIRSSWRKLTNNNSLSHQETKVSVSQEKKDNTPVKAEVNSKVSENVKSMLMGNMPKTSESETNSKVSDKIKDILMNNTGSSRTKSTVLPPVIYLPGIQNEENKENINNTIIKNDRQRRTDRYKNIVNNNRQEMIVANENNEEINKSQRIRRVEKLHNNVNNPERVRRVERLHNSINNGYIPNMHFSDAYQILRDNSNKYSDKDKNDALNVLARTFGKHNLTSDDIKKKLSDFNKLQQLLSYYGNKVNNGNATLEDMNTYGRLLDQFAKYNGNDYTINDFFADEAYESVHKETKER